MSDSNRTSGASGTGSSGGTGSGIDFDADTSSADTAPVSFEPAATLGAEDDDAATSGTGSVDDAIGEAADAAKGAKATLKDEASRLGRQATDQARGLVDEGKTRATTALDDFSKMMEDAAGTVDEKLGEQYGQYARSAAQAISGFSDQIRDKQVEDLLTDARDFVRASPAIAIGTAAALGFVIARVLKAGIEGVDASTGPGTTPPSA